MCNVATSSGVSKYYTKCHTAIYFPYLTLSSSNVLTQSRRNTGRLCENFGTIKCMVHIVANLQTNNLPKCTVKEQALLIFERKIFRKIYGPGYENGEWKSRTNRELEEMSRGENIIKWIKEQRISWLGHLERMEEERMPKRIFTQELEGTRRRGRPRKG